MEDDPSNVLLKAIKRVDGRVDSISEDVNRIERDMTDDREQLAQMNLRLKQLEESDEEIRKAINTLQKKTNDSIRSAVRDSVKPLENKIDDWVEKKVIRVRTKKRSLLQWIRDYFESLKDWDKEVKKDG